MGYWTILKMCLNGFERKNERKKQKWEEEKECVALEKAVQSFHKNSHALLYSLHPSHSFKFAFHLHKIKV